MYYTTKLLFNTQSHAFFHVVDNLPENVYSIYMLCWKRLLHTQYGIPQDNIQSELIYKTAITSDPSHSSPIPNRVNNIII